MSKIGKLIFLTLFLSQSFYSLLLSQDGNNANSPTIFNEILRDAGLNTSEIKLMQSLGINTPKAFLENNTRVARTFSGNLEAYYKIHHKAKAHAFTSNTELLDVLLNPNTIILDAPYNWIGKPLEEVVNIVPDGKGELFLNEWNKNTGILTPSGQLVFEEKNYPKVESSSIDPILFGAKLEIAGINEDTRIKFSQLGVNNSVEYFKNLDLIKTVLDPRKVPFKKLEKVMFVGLFTPELPIIEELVRFPELDGDFRGFLDLGPEDICPRINEGGFAESCGLIIESIEMLRTYLSTKVRLGVASLDDDLLALGRQDFLTPSEIIRIQKWGKDKDGCELCKSHNNLFSPAVYMLNLVDLILDSIPEINSIEGLNQRLYSEINEISFYEDVSDEVSYIEQTNRLLENIISSKKYGKFVNKGDGTKDLIIKTSIYNGFLKEAYDCPYPNILENLFEVYVNEFGITRKEVAFITERNFSNSFQEKYIKRSNQYLLIEDLKVLHKEVDAQEAEKKLDYTAINDIKLQLRDFIKREIEPLVLKEIQENRFWEIRNEFSQQYKKLRTKKIDDFIVSKIEPDVLDKTDDITVILDVIRSKAVICTDYGSQFCEYDASYAPLFAVELAYRKYGMSLGWEESSVEDRARKETQALMDRFKVQKVLEIANERYGGDKSQVNPRDQKEALLYAIETLQSSPIIDQELRQIVGKIVEKELTEQIPKEGFDGAVDIRVEKKWREVVQRIEADYHRRVRENLIKIIFKDSATKGLGLIRDASSSEKVNRLSDFLHVDLLQQVDYTSTPISFTMGRLQSMISFGFQNGDRAYKDLESTDAYQTPKIGEQTWEWLRSYGTWHAAMQVYFYPENYLRDELRENRTWHFQEYVKNIPLEEYDNIDHLLDSINVRYVQNVLALNQLEPFFVDEKDGSIHFFANNGFEIYHSTLSTNNFWNSWKKLDIELPNNSDFNKIDRKIEVLKTSQGVLFFGISTNQANYLSIKYSGNEVITSRAWESIGSIGKNANLYFFYSNGEPSNSSIGVGYLDPKDANQQEYPVVNPDQVPEAEIITYSYNGGALSEINSIASVKSIWFENVIYTKSNLNGDQIMWITGPRREMSEEIVTISITKEFTKTISVKLPDRIIELSEPRDLKVYNRTSTVGGNITDIDIKEDPERLSPTIIENTKPLLIEYFENPATKEKHLLAKEENRLYKLNGQSYPIDHNITLAGAVKGGDSYLWFGRDGQGLFFAEREEFVPIGLNDKKNYLTITGSDLGTIGNLGAGERTKGSFAHVYYEELAVHIPKYFADKYTNLENEELSNELLEQFIDFDAYDAGEGIEKALAKDLGEFNGTFSNFIQDPFKPYNQANVSEEIYLVDIKLDFVDNLIAQADELFAQDNRESINSARILYNKALRILDRGDLTPDSCAIYSQDLSELVDLEYASPQGAIALLAGSNANPLGWDYTYAPESVSSAYTATYQSKYPFVYKSLNVDCQYQKLLLTNKGETLGPVYLGTIAADGVDFSPRVYAREFAMERGAFTYSGTTNNDEKLWFNNLLRIEQTTFCLPKNPRRTELYWRASTQLEKIRTGQNIAGINRELPQYSLEIDPDRIFSAGGISNFNSNQIQHNFPPIYRYSFLVDRAKYLVSVARQFETSLLNAKERLDETKYNIFRAQQDLQLEKAQIALYQLQEEEAQIGIQQAGLQLVRAREQFNNYDNLISKGLNSYEKASIGFQIAATSALSFGSAVDAANPFKWIFGTIGPDESNTQELARNTASILNTTASFYQTKATHERRKEDWQLARVLAKIDGQIAQSGILQAENRFRIAQQSTAIGNLRFQQASDRIYYIHNSGKENLYEWMKEEYRGLYKEQMRLASATAKAAQQALEFERQENFNFIGYDYSQFQKDGVYLGAERLLQDINKLEQERIASVKRKRELTKTVSLSNLAPEAFQDFRETGLIEFSTHKSLFDRDFPGHYMRTIKNVEVSVIALTSNGSEVHATLSNTGLSRVMIGPPFDKMKEIYRLPESISISSAVRDDGVFVLRPDDPLLYPFEGSGVVTNWRFEMDKGANAIDFETIYDIFLTFNYTAIEDRKYRRKVLEKLGQDDFGNISISAKRFFSLRNEFADQWYYLQNPILNANTSEYIDPILNNELPSADQLIKPYTTILDIQKKNFLPNEGSRSIRKISLAANLKRDNNLGYERITLPLKLKFYPDNRPDTFFDDLYIQNVYDESYTFNTIPPYGSWVLQIDIERLAEPLKSTFLNADGNTETYINLDLLEDILFIVDYHAKVQYNLD